MTIDNSCFGSIDIRGIYPEQVNEELTYSIGRCFVKLFKAKKVVVGNDIRLSGPELKQTLISGLRDSGCDVIDIGQCGTEMIYFATFHMKLDGGIMITASHNPKEYNGIKIVKKEAKPVSRDSGLNDLKIACNNGDYAPKSNIQGKLEVIDIMYEYIQHILSYVNVSNIKPLKIVANTGNGAAGPIINELEKILPVQFIKIYNNPDGNFPNGVPNPMLVENRENTARAVREYGADLGIAWDGDFDRCFFFDEKGNFIEGYYIVGFLAEAFLRKHKGERIIYDSRVNWNTIDICECYGGEAVLSKSGHSFIKEKMREVNAIYGGEMSAHHYFRDFSYCDSGMITCLLVIELLSITDKTMSAMLQERIDKYPCSGEINIKLDASSKCIIDIFAAIEIEYKKLDTCTVNKIDGLTIEYIDWRFNLRKSNTEPVIRLNVECRNNKALLERKTKELLREIYRKAIQ